MVEQAQKKAVTRELGHVLLLDDTITRITANLEEKGFGNITEPQVREVLESLYSSLGNDSHSPDRAEDETKPTSEADPSYSGATDPVSIYPRALPGWDQRATHAIQCGHQRAFGRYDIETNYMTLLSGSGIAREWMGDEIAYGEALENILTLPGTTRSENRKLILIVDVECTSPACAASLVSGNSKASSLWQVGHGRRMPRLKRKSKMRFENGFMATPLSGSGAASSSEKDKESTVTAKSKTQDSFDPRGSVSGLALNGVSSGPNFGKTANAPVRSTRRRKKKK